MKYLITVILLIVTVVTANDWKLILKTDVQPLSKTGITCPDSNNCFVYAQQLDYTLLFKSTNQGVSWEKIFQSSHIDYALELGTSPHPDYYFMTKGQHTIIKKSIDGGKTFKHIELMPDSGSWMSRQLLGLAMYDSLIGFAQSGYWHFVTRDGWETFEKINRMGGGYQSPAFINDSIIAIILTPSVKYPPVAYTFQHYNINQNKFDTLFTFPEMTESEDYHQIRKFVFINDTLGFACGHQPTGLGDNQNDLIYKTTDGGQNWELILYGFEIGSYNFGLIDIDFYDPKNGVAVGMGGHIWMTNDSGNTWYLNPKPPEMLNPFNIEVAWAGQHPIIVTSDSEGGIYRYEGNFFDFSPDTAVKLITMLPVPGEDSVSVSTKITVKFFDILDTSKFNEYSFTITNLSSTGEYIKGSYNFNFSDSTLIFIPESILPYLSVIQVNLNNIYDLAGNVLKQYSYTFTTEPDTTIGVKEKQNKEKISIRQSPEKLFIYIYDEHFRKYKLQIYDIMGNVVKEFDLSSGIGTLYIPYDISDLTSGAYLYMISTEGIVVKTGKLISITN